MGSVNAPFQDTRGVVWAELRLDAQCGGFDFVELDTVEGILFHAAGGGVRGRLPIVAGIASVQKFPRLRGAAAAGGGVVEPVDLNLADPSRPLEVVLDPLGRALVRPPREAWDAMVVRTRRDVPVAQGGGRVALPAV